MLSSWQMAGFVGEGARMCGGQLDVIGGDGHMALITQQPSTGAFPW